MSNYSENFGSQSEAERQDVLTMFSDSALYSMVDGGYWNDFTGELMTISADELETALVARYATEEATAEPSTEDALNAAWEAYKAAPNGSSELFHAHIALNQAKSVHYGYGTLTAEEAKAQIGVCG